jgi:thioredoxin 1
MASELVNHVTDANFDQEVLKSDKAVLIDFWAPWCAPCRAIAPLIDELAGEYAGRLKVVKINVDDNPETPARYGVRGIPNLLIIKSGQVKEQIVGAVPKSHLVRAVDSALVSHPPGLRPVYRKVRFTTASPRVPTWTRAAPFYVGSST